MNIKIYMNCKEKHSELPLKSFYRYTIDAEPRFHSATGALAPLMSFRPYLLRSFAMSVPQPGQMPAKSVTHPQCIGIIRGATVGLIVRM